MLILIIFIFGFTVFSRFIWAGVSMTHPCLASCWRRRGIAFCCPLEIRHGHVTCFGQWNVSRRHPWDFGGKALSSACPALQLGTVESHVNLAGVRWTQPGSSGSTEHCGTGEGGLGWATKWICSVSGHWEFGMAGFCLKTQPILTSAAGGSGFAVLGMDIHCPLKRKKIQFKKIHS